MAQRPERQRSQRASKRRAAEKIVRSVTDPEAMVAYDQEGVDRPLDNVQLVDDLAAPLVLAYDGFAQPNDAGLLAPRRQRARPLLGHGLEAMLADTGAAGGAAVAVAAEQGVTLYAPLPAEPQGARAQLPKSAFVWLAEVQTQECPQGHRLD
jgi:hypothetical protein